MLAVAGTKGGCGKTTTAIGIAEAFARADVPAVAVDADRQLPNVHVIGDVDREPTLATIDEGDAVSDVAARSPRESNAQLLPAPLSSETVPFESTLSRVADAPARAVIDCPSGAGPDGVEPLSVADRAIVVTTDAKRSIEGARVTVEMAGRLDVPVAGIVVNQCESVPPTIVEATDSPILGAVPDRPDPLTHPETRAAYDRIAAELTNRWDSKVPDATDRFTTGIDSLDAQLGGGIPNGSVVSVVAEPNSQSEQLLYALTAARGTLYLSVERSQSLVQEAVETAAVTPGEPVIRHLDGPDILSEAMEFVESLPDGANLVIDSMDLVERADRERFQKFMNGLLDRVRETESVVFLHCLDSEDEPALRPLTTHFADLVFELEVTMNVAGVSQRLTVPKHRGEPIPQETIELDLIAESVLPTRKQSVGD